jgi:hypothetical protein
MLILMMTGIAKSNVKRDVQGLCSNLWHAKPCGNSLYPDSLKEGKVCKSRTYKPLKVKAWDSFEISGYVELPITQFNIPEHQYFFLQTFTYNADTWRSSTDDIQSFHVVTYCSYSLQPPMAFVSQSKTLVTNKTNYVINIAIYVNRMVRWLDRNTWTYTASGECNCLKGK